MGGAGLGLQAREGSAAGQELVWVGVRGDLEMVQAATIRWPQHTVCQGQAIHCGQGLSKGLGSCKEGKGYLRGACGGVWRVEGSLLGGECEMVQAPTIR